MVPSPCLESPCTCSSVHLYSSCRSLLASFTPGSRGGGGREGNCISRNPIQVLLILSTFSVITLLLAAHHFDPHMQVWPASETLPQALPYKTNLKWLLIRAQISGAALGPSPSPIHPLSLCGVCITYCLSFPHYIKMLERKKKRKKKMSMIIV